MHWPREMNVVLLLILAVQLSESIPLHITNLPEDHLGQSEIEMAECGIVLSKIGLLEFSGQGIYTVETVVGKGQMDISNMRSLLFFGPLHVSNGTCSQIIEANPICHDHSSDSGLFEVPCKNSMSTLTASLIWLSCLVLFIEILIIRYLYITKWFTIDGYTLLTLTANGNEWCYKLVSKAKMTVLFVKEEDKSKALLPSGAEGDFKILKINKRKIILFFLFLTSPVDQSMARVLHKDTNVLEDISMSLAEGDKIVLGNFSLLALKARRSHPVTYLYDTYNFSTFSENDWHCSDSACNSHGQCGVGGATGVPDGHKAWRMEKDTHLHFYQRFCNWGSTGCFLHQGCYMWFIDVQMRDNDKTQVYDVGPAIQDNEVRTNDARDCIVRSVEDKTPTFVSKWTLVDRLGKMMLCPFQDNHRNPTKGALGDVQLFSDMSIAIDQSMFSCVHSSTDGPSCSAVSSSLESVLSRCSPIPGRVGSSLFKFEEGFLIEESGEALHITLSCRKESIKLMSNVSCGGVTLFLYGREKSQDGIILLVKPVVKDDHSTWEGVIPCTHKKYTIPCNSHGLAIRVPWPSACLDSMNITSRHIIPENTLTDYETLELGSRKYEEPGSGILDEFSRTLTMGWHLLPLPMPIIIILVLVCVRR